MGLFSMQYQLLQRLLNGPAPTQFEGPLCGGKGNVRIKGGKKVVFLDFMKGKVVGLCLCL